MSCALSSVQPDLRGIRVIREHIFGALDYDSFVQTMDKYLSGNQVRRCSPML